MKVAYCEKCGRRVVIREAAGHGEDMHVLCDACRREAPGAGEPGVAAGPRAATSPVSAATRTPAVRRKTSAYKRATPGSTLQPVDGAGPAVLSSRTCVAAVLAGGLLMSLGLFASYLIFGRGAAGDPAVATQASPTGGAPPARLLASEETAGAGEPREAMREPAPAASGDATPSANAPDNKKAPAASEAARRTKREPIGGWGQRKSVERETPSIDEPTTEKPAPEATPDEPAKQTGEPAQEPVPPEAVEPDTLSPDTAAADAPPDTKETEAPEPPREIPKMPQQAAEGIRAASEMQARYEVLDSIATLTRHYRFAEAAARLEKRAEADELWATAAGELARASGVLRGMGETVRELEGKHIDVKLRIGRLRGVVRGYSPGIIRIMNDAGTPSLLSLKRAPFRFLRDLAKGASDEDFITYCVYSGRGLPEGKSKGDLSEAAQLILEYPEWSSREKKAEGALKRLRKMREKEDWAELIAGSVEAAQEYMGTYAVGVKARGELGGMLKEALAKKKKTITYQRGAQPSEGYDGVKDGYISSYVISPGNTEQTTNYGGKKVMVLWSTNRRSIIRFDLSGLPKDARVHKATLELYCLKMGYAEKTTAAIYLLAEDWVEGKGTYGAAKAGTTWDFTDAMGQKRWSTPGGSVVLEDDFGGGTAGIVTTGVVEPEKWTRLDVTKGVDVWLSGKRPNCGFLMRLAAGATGYVEHYASEIEDPALRPKLTMEYEGTVKGQEAVVPEDLQWLLHEAGRETESDTKVEGTEI